MDPRGGDVIRVRLIDHVVLRTRQPDAMVRFSERVLGCRVERRLPAPAGLTQLRAGRSLIDLVDADSALGRAGGPPPTASGNNLDHFCLQIEAVDPQELRGWLEANGVETGDFEVRYGAEAFGPSVYIRDPDGNVVELRPAAAPRGGADPRAPGA